MRRVSLQMAHFDTSSEEHPLTVILQIFRAKLPFTTIHYSQAPRPQECGKAATFAVKHTEGGKSACTASEVPGLTAYSYRN